MSSEIHHEVEADGKMDSRLSIEITDLSKCYRIFRNPHDRLKQSIWRGRRQFFEEFWALRNISFRVERGHTVGIIGRNGSGKSTLLQVIASTLAPTTGSVQVRGRIAALLELGAGFNPEFTGIENIRLNASILGLTGKQIDATLDKIIAFADIGEFIDQPVKKYSTGMYARLGFSIGIHVAPDIFVIDEALSVGDVFFQSRCFKKLNEFRESGGTVLFVSHDTSAVSRICDQAIVLHRGELAFDGPGNDAINVYYRVGRDPYGTDPLPVDAEAGDDASVDDLASVPPVPIKLDHVTGDGAVTIEAIRIVNADGAAQNAFEVGASMRVIIDAHFHRDIDSFDVGVGVRDRTGLLLGGAHSHYLEPGRSFGPATAGSRMRIAATVKLEIEAGKYLLLIGISKNFSHETWEEYCVLWDCCAIDVFGVPAFWGMTRLEAHVEIVNPVGIASRSI